jgi:chromosome segregation ATPase
MTGMQGEMAGMRGEMTGMQGEMAGMRGEMTFLRGDMAGMQGDMAGLRGEMTGLRGEILGHFDELYRRLERLEQEYHTIILALRRIEAGSADERGRREILVRDLEELKRQVIALQSRIEEIEQRLGRRG